MNNWSNILKGYLTYVGGFLLMVVGIVKLITALQETPMGNVAEAAGWISGGLAVLGGRRALGEVQKELDKKPNGTCQ